MNDNNDIALKRLVSNGLISKLLGEKLSNENDDDFLIGEILESAIRATQRAYEEARETKIPVYFTEGEILYSIDSNGNKKYIKEIKKPTEKYPSQFKLT